MMGTGRPFAHPTDYWLSIVLTQKIARQPFLSLLPQHLATVAIASLMWKVIVGW
jgi:hypothetical protein